MLTRITAVLFVAAALVAALYYSQWQTGPLIVSGYIEADEIRLGSRVGGRVIAVHAGEGDEVTAGTVLVELDPFDLRQQREEAAANLARARAVLEKRESGFREEEVAQAKARVDRLQATLEKLIEGPRREDIDAARAQLELAEAELQRAQTKYDRVMALAERQAANPDEVDDATRNLRVAQAEVNVREAELAKLLAGTREEEIAEARAQLDEAEQAWRLMQRGYRTEEIAEARAAAAAAEQRVDAIDQKLKELKIIAPADGTIETMELQVGDLVPANSPALSMIDHDALWVRAYVPEDELDISLNQTVEVMVDSYPNERFRAHIGFIARQAEFTPSNIQTPEERSKQVFRIKVHLDEGLDRLRPGMAADVILEKAGEDAVENDPGAGAGSAMS